MSDGQQQRTADPAPWNKSSDPLDSGPHSPNISKPDTSSIIKKLKRVERDGSKKYRQRSGQ